MKTGNQKGGSDAEVDSDGVRPGVALLGKLRRQMPVRQLAYWEHLQIAERQAVHLHTLQNQHDPGVDMDWLSSNRLGNIVVVLEGRWRMEGLSGMTTWDDATGRWIIGINKSNPQARRRFTLAHEFKHVLDANRDKLTYQGLSAGQREQIADYFAACYLMPKLALRRAWTSGIQEAEALAGLFKVSLQAMEKRLKYLQYIDDAPERAVTSYFRRQSGRLRTVGQTMGSWMVADAAENELDAPEVAARGAQHVMRPERAA